MTGKPPTIFTSCAVHTARPEPVIKDDAKTIRCRGPLKLVRFIPNGRGCRYKIVLDIRVHRRAARKKCGGCLRSRKYETAFCSWPLKLADLRH
jgi:hypothetical protein